MKQYIKVLIAMVFIGLSQSGFSQCFDDGHSPFDDQGWLSCTTSVNPIPERGNGHWILYDLGENYTVDELYLWNHNVWGETGMGVRQILIDYSKDKENWSTAGPFTIEKAPGSWKYTGVEGPSLNSARGRYFLITVINTWDNTSSCAGLGEIKFLLGTSTDNDDVVVEDQAMTLSPNPAIEMIKISLPNQAKINQITIRNSVGQSIKDLDITMGREMTIDVSDLTDGMYHVSVYTDEGIETKSFVKVGGV